MDHALAPFFAWIGPPSVTLCLPYKFFIFEKRVFISSSHNLTWQTLWLLVISHNYKSESLNLANKQLRNRLSYMQSWHIQRISMACRLGAIHKGRPIKFRIFLPPPPLLAYVLNVCPLSNLHFMLILWICQLFI